MPSIDDKDNEFLNGMMGLNQYANSSPMGGAPASAPIDTSDDEADASAPKPAGRPLLASNESTAIPGHIPTLSEMVSQSIQQRQGGGYGSDLNADALKAAQDQANKMRLYAMLGEASNTFSHGLSRAQGPVDNSFYQNAAKNADIPVQNLMDRRKAALGDITAKNQMAENDPNSEVSQNLRKVYSRMIPNLPDTTSAADLKNFFQSPSELLAKIQGQKDMKDAQFASVKAIKEMGLAASGNKQNTQQQAKVAQAYEHAQADPVIKQAKGQLAQSDELLSATADATTNPVSANALSALAARYVSGGQRINKQEMEALGGGAKDLSDKLTQIMSTGSKGTLTPENAAFMKKFVQVTRDTAAQTYEHALKGRAQSYGSIYGLDPNDLYQKFGGGQMQSSQNSQDPKISGYANQHGLSYEQAQQILKARGYGG